MFNRNRSVRAQLVSSTPLTDDQIQSVAPSAFALDKHESRSARYTYIPTVELIRGMRSEGWLPYSAQQSKARDDAKREHTKHQIRFARVEDFEKWANKGYAFHARGFNDVVITNSHDGSSGWLGKAGSMEFACTNCLLIPGTIIEEQRFRHSGDVIADVIEGAYKLMQSFERAQLGQDQMRSLMLTSGEKMAFARAAIKVRFDVEDVADAPVYDAQVVEARHWEQREDNLWNVFNRVQENLVQGGQRGRKVNGRRRAVRAVQGIDGNNRLNEALYALADEMRRMKAAS